MRKEIFPIFFIIFLLSLQVFSCTRIRFPRKQTTVGAVFYLEYDISLSEVNRPAETKNRYGEQIILNVDTGDEKYTQAFKDEMIEIFWELSPKKIEFILTNKTEHTVRIIWDESAFVDEFGMSHRLVHGEILKIDKNRFIPPSVIVRQGRFKTFVYPADYIGDSQSGLKPILPYKLSSQDVSVFEDSESTNRNKFFDNAKSKVGKTLQVLLPLEIEGIKNDYIFIFKINSVENLNEKRKSKT